MTDVLWLWLMTYLLLRAAVWAARRDTPENPDTPTDRRTVAQDAPVEVTR